MKKQTIETLIGRMKDKGYHYDGIESGPGNIRFYYIGGAFPLAFSSWREVRTWLDEVI